jgi:biotin operon repressor
LDKPRHARWQQTPAIHRPNNNLLNALREEDYRLLAPSLVAMEAVADTLLYNPGDDVEVVYFPCGASLAAFLITSDDGNDVEVTLVGREGAVGGIVSLGNLPAYCRIVVKNEGPFVRLSIRHLEAAKLKSASLRALFARYADCLLAQVFQSTACNAIHSIEQRTAKWITSALDRTGDDAVPMTQEQLAKLLGVGRSYVSRIIQTFKADGILETRRGALVVRKRDLLKARACRCNASVAGHFEQVLRGVYPYPEAAE